MSEESACSTHGPSTKGVWALQEKQRALQLEVEEAETVYEAVEGQLEQNLQRRRAELREQLATADVSADQ